MDSSVNLTKNAFTTTTIGTSANDFEYSKKGSWNWFFYFKQAIYTIFILFVLRWIVYLIKTKKFMEFGNWIDSISPYHMAGIGMAAGLGFSVLGAGW